jgi:hypothetical protein
MRTGVPASCADRKQHSAIREERRTAVRRTRLAASACEHQPPTRNITSAVVRSTADSQLCAVIWTI